VIDDNQEIHDDFRKVIGGGRDNSAALAAAELAILGESLGTNAAGFEVDSAFQGQEGSRGWSRHCATAGPMRWLRRHAHASGLGWIGDDRAAVGRGPGRANRHMFAHTDYDWTEVVARLNNSDKLLVVKKPFEAIEVLQCANALTRKWQNERIVRRQVEGLEQW